MKGKYCGSRKVLLQVVAGRAFFGDRGTVVSPFPSGTGSLGKARLSHVSRKERVVVTENTYR